MEGQRRVGISCKPLRAAVKRRGKMDFGKCSYLNVVTQLLRTMGMGGLSIMANGQVLTQQWWMTLVVGGGSPGCEETRATFGKS